MNFWNVLLWMGAIYLGFNFLFFLISVAVACYLLKSEAHKEDK